MTFSELEMQSRLSVKLPPTPAAAVVEGRHAIMRRVAEDAPPARRLSIWKLLLWGVAAVILLAVAAAWWALGPAFYRVVPGVLAERSRDYDAAIRHYRHVVERKPDAFMVAHDIACCYARKGDREQALLWLRRALETSYADYAREWARTEDDFASIRDTEEFRALVAGR